MNNSEKVLRAKVEIMTNDMFVIAEKLGHLVSPISAMKIIIEGIIEDEYCDDMKDRLADINTVADNCIKIIRELMALTMQYFDHGKNK